MSDDYEIPYFVEIAGCINCSVSHALREEQGVDYGYHHEASFACLAYGCFSRGITSMTPYIHPLEMARLAMKRGSKEAIQIGLEYCKMVNKVYGQLYEKMGISLEGIIGFLREQMIEVSQFEK